MIERVDVGIRHVGIGGQIPIGVEQRIWIAAFFPAKVLVMLEGIELCGLHIWIVLQVEDAIEAVRPDQRRERGQLPSLVLARLQEMRKRIDTSRRHVRVRGEIGRVIERSRRLAPFPPAGLIKVGERVNARLFHVLIEREIERGREEAVWIASFLPARLMIVLVGIDVCVPDIVIVRIVEQIVDQIASFFTVPSVNTKVSTPDSTVWLPLGPSTIT